jgi:hypothetical protein
MDSYRLSAAVLFGFALCALALAPFARRLKAEENAAASAAPAGQPATA